MSNATKTAKRSDFKKYFQFMWRSLNIQASWNYERQMNMGFLYGIAPTLDELYPNENDPEQLAHKKEAYEREMAFYNCTPQTSAFTLGLAASMEEQYAADRENFNPETINAVKTSLMGPLSGVGDSFFQGTVRLIAFGLGISLAQQGSVLGPILAMILSIVPSVLATCFPALSVSTFMWITNAVLDVLGCVFLGIKTMGWTLYSSFMLSFYSSMCEKLFPMSQPLTDDTLLELCFAVALPALASGIVFNIGASTGGTEIVAMILHKYIKVEIGRALLLSDIGTVLFAACIYGPQTGMYCVLGLIGRSTIVDTAIESLNLRKVCTVITSRPEPIRHFVTETLGRTATQQNATGVYTGEPRTMIMVALTRRQAGLLRDFLRREDPEAFLTIVNSSEIIGKGFRSV